MQTALPPSDQVRSIHYLRGVAALMVVLVHIFSFEVVPGWDASRTEWLKHGVAIFFVISGFVMVEATRTRKQSPIGFLSRRFVRVVPFWWAMLTIWVLIGAPFDTGWLAGSYALVPTLDPATGAIRLPVLGLGWTLFFEMAFYLLFALALFLPRNIGVWTVIAVLCITPWLKPLAADIPLLAFYLDAHFFEFAAGMIIAQCRLRAHWLFVPIGLTGLATLEHVGLPHILAISLPAALVIAGGRGLDARLPDMAFPRRLGDASYAIYLSHMVVIHLVTSYLTPLDVPALSVIAALSGAVAFGIWVHLRVEKPLIAYLRQRSIRHVFLNKPKLGIPASHACK